MKKGLSTALPKYLAVLAVPLLGLTAVSASFASSNYPSSLGQQCVNAGLRAPSPQLDCSACHVNTATPRAANNPPAYSTYLAGGATRLTLCLPAIMPPPVVTPPPPVVTPPPPVVTPPPGSPRPPASRPGRHHEGHDHDDDHDHDDHQGRKDD